MTPAAVTEKPMRKLAFVLAAVLSAAAGCGKKGDALEPIDFSSASYTVYNGGEVGIALAVVRPVPSDISIPVTISGAAGGFALSSPVVTIGKGEIAGSVSLKDIALTPGTKLTVSFTPPAGYTAGRVAQTVVAYDEREALSYSFVGTEGTFEEGMSVSIVLTGVRSGNAYSAEADFTVGGLISGDGGENDGHGEIAFREGGFAVKKGAATATGHLIRSHSTDIEKPLTAWLGVDPGDSRYVRGANPVFKLTIPRWIKEKD